MLSFPPDTGRLRRAFVRGRGVVNRRRAPAPADGRPATIPKILYLYWAQGFEDAPPLIRRSVDSWQRHHPHWDVRLLTADDLDGVEAMRRIDRRERLGAAHLSDVYRLALLAEYGGVWADTTTICTQPLDCWLPTVGRSGFFCFARPHPGRLMANWFLASTAGHPITDTMLDALTDHWRTNDDAVDYFLFHHTFEWLVLTDRRFRRSWRQVPRIAAGPSHLLASAATAHSGARPTTSSRDLMSMRDATPVHKFDRRSAEAAEELLDRLDGT